MFRLFSVTLAVLCPFLQSTQAFTPSIALSGPVGNDLKMHAVPRSIAYKYIRRTHVEYIQKDFPKSILDEMNDARELLRDPKTSDWRVSFMVPNSTKQNLFMVLYRMNSRFPKCYTVEAVVRDHSIEPGNGSMTMLELERTLNQMVRERRGHLQIHSLRSWAGGRYMKELEVERKFLSDTLDQVHTPSSHSGPDDDGDFRNFGISI